MQSILVSLALLSGSVPPATADSLPQRVAPARRDTGFSLTLVHVNDLHAQLDPSVETMKLQGKPVRISLGGAAVLKAAFDSLRRTSPNPLFLHAGDQFTGTAWFSVYRGLVDAEVVRRLGFDAFVPGNHEFDAGASTLRAFLDSSGVPVVASTLDAAREPELAHRIPPILFREIAGRRIAFVGILHPRTASISKPGQNLRFLEAASVSRSVDSARRAGAQVVVALSHAGFEQDTLLARTVAGLSVVVGGHSHTRMGSFPGLGGSVPYPFVTTSVDGSRVPVVQAWHKGMEIGVITLRFDSLARLVSWQGSPFLPTALGGASGAPQGVREFAADSSMSDYLRVWSGPLDSLRARRVAWLPRRITRGGGELADLCARSLLEASGDWGAKVAIVNPGGVRDDLDSGLVTQEDVQRVSPFGNTVVVLTLTGKKLRHVVRILEGRRQGPGVAGLAGSRDGKGRWTSFRLEGQTADLGDDDTVRVATNSYLAEGGDGCLPLRKTKGWRLDTGIPDDQALAGWLGRRFGLPKGR